MSENENNFQDNLRELMRASKTTLRDVEIGTGIPSSSIFRWAQEGAIPRLERRLLILAEYFDVTLEQLFFGDCSKKSHIKLIKERIRNNTACGKIIE